MENKNQEYLNFLKTRISPHVKPEVAQMMLDYALSPEEHASVTRDIEEYCFSGKTPVEFPVAYLVIGQTGSGKSNLTALVKNSDANVVVIDSDAFKAFNPKKNEIIEKHLSLYGYLTGLDAYLHRDEIYTKALTEKYNILIEIAPSTKELLFNVNFEELKGYGYTVNANVMAACLENSLLSVHERYEGQIEANMEAPKLTDLKRAIDSYDAMPMILKQLIEMQDVETLLFQRSPYVAGDSELKQIELPKFVSSNKETMLDDYYAACEADRLDMQDSIDERIELVEHAMDKRKAPADQRAQFSKVVERVKQKSK